LYDELRHRDPTVGPAEVVELVWRLAREDAVDIVDIPPATESLRAYLKVWNENLWLYISLTTSIVAFLCVNIIPGNSPLVVLRWILGTALVVFVPGYVMLKALFPGRRDLDGFIRFALSIGLSMVCAILVGLFLNYTPWGIRFTPILLSMTGLTIGFTFVALKRQFARAVAQFHLESSDRS
jgi:uncharacterized membrane protein